MSRLQLTDRDATPQVPPGEQCLSFDDMKQLYTLPPDLAPHQWTVAKQSFVKKADESVSAAAGVGIC